MNESVKAMIAKLHARLDDLSEVVKEIPFELNGYNKKLDKIDDRIYLIEVELEKKLKNAVRIPTLNDEQADAFDKAASSSKARTDTSASQVTGQGASSGQSGSSAQSSVHVVEKEGSGTSKVTITEEPERETAEEETAKKVKAKEEDKEDKEEGFLTDSAKETIAGATKTLNSFYKDGKEVFGEFSEALGDIKEVFGKNNIFKKR